MIKVYDFKTKVTSELSLQEFEKKLNEMNSELDNCDGDYASFIQKSTLGIVIDKLNELGKKDNIFFYHFH